VRKISVTTEINAPAEIVWAQLADTASFPSWNPFIPALDGKLAVGERLRVRIAPPDSRPMTFRPTVTAAEPGRRLEWLGRLLFPGLLDGRHTFTLEPTEHGTRLTQSEEFTGLLVALTAGTLTKTQEGFRLMNEAVKTRAEQAHAGS
jgi:hypothetical protein